jgi:SAM-dependent methyltransferase
LSLANRISAFNRRRKWKQFESLFDPGQRILDVGYTDHEYSDVENFLEKHHPNPERIVALGIHKPREFHRRYPAVRVVAYDGGRFPFADASFDVCWANAVIEHVGPRQRQLEFLREINRVSRSAFVTTPNRHFPVEVHTKTPLLHFLPQPWFDSYLRAVGKGWAAGDYMHLLSLNDVRSLLAEAGVASYRIRRNRLGPFTMDFAISWGSPAAR